MAEGFKDFVAATVATSTDVDDYLMRQTIMRFASAAARNSALSGVLVEGLVAYLKDVNTLTMYDGSSWVDLLTVGAWTAYTPVSSHWTIGNGTLTGAYQKVGRMVTCRGSFGFGSSTTPSSTLVLSVPVAAVTPVWAFGGNMTDASAGVLSPLAFLIGSATSTSLEPYAMTAVNQINNAGITSTVPWTWAAGDSVSWLFTYEATS